MAASVSRSPTSSQVHRRILQLQEKHRDWVKVSVINQSEEGRPIAAVTLTDPGQSDEDKQNVLVVAGQHGNEESARLVALKLMDYLLTAAGRKLLARQKIVVMPNLSPDAAEHNTYETPAGIKPNLDHGPDGPVSPEAKALSQVAEQLMPEVYVDVHACGHVGFSHDMVLFPATRPYTEDERTLYQIANRMAEEGEKSGIPHIVHPLTWPGWGGTDLNEPSSTLYLYRRFKSLVFLTENAEHDEATYPPAVQARSGVNRFKPLLAMGNRRHPCFYYEGYPCPPAVGMYHAGAVAVGETAAARRQSRVEIWRNRSGFAHLKVDIPEPADRKLLRVRYEGSPLTAGIGFQVRFAGHRRLREVRMNGRTLVAGTTDGYFSWTDRHTTFAVASLPQFQAGEYEVLFVMSDGVFGT